MIDCLKMYLNMGWALFPCLSSGPKAKAPLTEHGHKDASLDLAQVEEWLRQYPGCAWGSPTSAGRGVIDIDISKGGTESLAALVAEYAHGRRGA